MSFGLRTKLALMFVSIVLGLLLSELIVSMTGKYEELVHQGLEPSNTVWTRYANNIEHKKHPDLGYPVHLRFDSYGIRNHTDIASDKYIEPIGLFGDSYAENRRIDNRFTISTMLNQVIGATRVINFGIDGFGLEQSFQNYLNRSEDISLKHVIYLFCANDLGELQAVHLFDIRDGSQLVNRVEEKSITAKEWITRKLGKLRLSYLMVEAAYRLRGKWNKTTHNELNKRLYDDLDERLNLNDIINRTYFSPIVQDLLNKRVNNDTAKIIDKFNLILSVWARHLSENGIGFTVAVLPRKIDKFVFGKIIETSDDRLFDVILLPESGEVVGLEMYGSYFSNDYHWNEVGNLAALPTVYQHLIDKRLVEHNRTDMSDFVSNKIQEIETLYKEFGIDLPSN